MADIDCKQLDVVEQREGYSKKPFDKKKWRELKYSKKVKIDQWEQRRKKAALRKYHKELLKDNPSQREDRTSNKEEKGTGKSRPVSAYQAAQLEFERKRREQQQQKEEILRRRKEKEAALNKYHQTKMERYKKLSKKTSKGQPVMGDRMQMLLDKIQRQI